MLVAGVAAVGSPGGSVVRGFPVGRVEAPSPRVVGVALEHGAGFVG